MYPHCRSDLPYKNTVHCLPLDAKKQRELPSCMPDSPGAVSPTLLEQGDRRRVAELQPSAPPPSSWAAEYDFVLMRVMLPQQSSAVGSVGCLLASSCWSQRQRVYGKYWTEV